MSVKSKPYFWVECDGDRCTAKVPDGDEYSACEELKQVIESAQEFGWVITMAGKLYCEDCVTEDDKDSAHLVSDVRGDTLPGLAS
jgi:uncharacterized protein (UPF0128 family)